MIELPRVIDDLNAVTESHRKVSPRRWNRASEAGWIDDCLRYLCIVRLHPEILQKPNFTTQSRFDQGHLQHHIMKLELAEAGWDVDESERTMDWPKLQLSGRIDGKLRRTGTDRPKYPAEFKSCSPDIFRSITRADRIEDLLDSNFIWIRHYPAQMMLYLLLHNEEDGLIIFKDKSSGLKFQLDVHLLYSYTEHLLRGLEEVNDYVSKAELPPARRIEACAYCELAQALCYVGKDFGPGLEFVNEPETVARFNRWYTLMRPAKEWRSLDEDLKDEFRGRNALVGNDYKVTSSTYKQTVYKIPDDQKAAFAEKEDRTRVSIVRLIPQEVEEL